MQILKSETFKLNNTIVTLGKFDGNHIGHKSLFEAAKRIKEKSDLPLSTVIFTFDINPRKVLSGSDVSMLYTNAERLQIEADEGIDYIVEWPFTKENMSMEPEEFLSKVLCAQLGVKYIVVGEDFGFGKGRSGNVKTLESLKEKYGFEVYAAEKVKYKGLDVSSTRIKEELLNGNLEDANHMLGRPFCVASSVVAGKHLGKSLGFPTINFTAPPDKVLPPCGVYATKTRVGTETYISMTNIGTRPTFEEGAARNIETNIFDFDEDIYGRSAVVEFYAYIRPEKHFESAKDLVAEIEKNKIQIKNFFDSYGEHKQ